MKYKLLAFAELIVVFFVLVYMAAFPIFPEIRSADFEQHLSVSMAYAQGHFQPVSAQLLYSGVEWYLSIGQRLFPHADPFVMVRWSMALLVIVSPVMVYFTSREIFRSFGTKRDRELPAKTTTLVYTLSGFLWFQMVFISGLYANFYGVLSSLGLVAATLWLTRDRFSMKKAGVFALLLFNAYFSHYSTLMVFPPLVAFLAWKFSRKHSPRLPIAIAVSGLVIPPVLGIFLFPSLAAAFSGFLGPSPGIGLSPGIIASVIPVPSVKFLAAEVADYGFFLLMVGVLFAGSWAVRKKDPLLLTLLAWFILPLVVAPFNSGAWRFSFVSLVPGTLLVGWTLSRIPKFPFKPAKGPSHMKRGVLFVLLILPLFTPSSSFAFQGLGHASASPYASVDPSVYSSLLWIGRHLQNNYTATTPTGATYLVCTQSPQDPHCPHILSVTDWRIGYASLFGGPNVLYAPDYNVVVTDPGQAQFFAYTHNSSYLVVTKDPTYFQLQCQPSLSYGLTLTASKTELAVNQTVRLDLAGSQGLNASVTVWENGKQAFQARLVNGSASVLGSYPEPGVYSLILGIGDTETLPLDITVGSNPTPSGPSSVSVPPDFCDYYRIYNPATLPGWTIIYENAEVMIWKAPQS